MKTALITGASNGIGLELAKLCANDGYNLVLVSRTPVEIKGTGSVLLISRDLSLPNSAQAVFDEVTKAGIEVDVLINNAGFGDYGPFETADLARMTSMMHLNMASLTELTRLFLPDMKERGSGKILNVASTAGFFPGPLMAVYYATKAYVVSFSYALREELRGTGVTVTVLCPGPTETNFAQSAGATKTGIFKARRLPSAQTVAEVGYRALMRGDTLSVVSLQNKLAIFLSRFFPRTLLARAVRHLHQS